MGKREFKRTIKTLEEHRKQLLMEIDCIDHLLQAGSLINYDFMIDFAIKKGFKRVVDIGCAYGHQAELCKGRIEYVGIDEDRVDFYNVYEGNVYYPNKYPFFTNGLFWNDLAICNLSIGWNCYDNEKEAKENFKALSEDFKACLLYLPTDRENLLRECFKKVEVYKKSESKLVPTAFYYCHN